MTNTGNRGTKMESFLKDNGRKLIITDNVSGVNKIVRHYSANSAIYGVDVLTINQLATEIVLADLALKEPDRYYKIIDGNMQAMRMVAVLKNMEVSFLKNETKTLSSANEILDVLNKIRNASPSDYFKNPDKNSKRICELKQILDGYEKLLEDNCELDATMVLNKAINILKSENDKANLAILSSNLNANVIGEFFADELSDLETQFTGLLKGILGNRYVTLEVDYQSEHEYEFFKAYGIANEVSNIRNTIIEKELPFGDVAIIYPTEAYEHFLMSELDEAKIKYCFPKGFNAQSTDYISFIMDLLDFARSDFEYKRLYKALQNPIVQIKKSRRAYRAFLSAGIGYGRDRYISFFERYESLPADEKIRNEEYVPFNQFLVELINCFDPKISCEEIYRRLIKISKTYTDNKNLYRACVRDELNNFAGALSIWEGDDFSDKLFQIESFIKKLKCSTSESPDAVSILPYGKTEIIDRKYIFAVGLSNENISVPNSESPVLCDKEMKSCVNGKVQLAMERNRRMKEAFEKTLSLSMQKKVYCSYSYYDTVSIISNSPSLLFQELLVKNGLEEKDISCIKYKVSKDFLKLSKPDISNNDNQKAEDAKKTDESDETDKAEKEDNFQSYKTFSASSLQTLINCPMRYYYEKERWIPQLNFQERTPDSWLPANVKGNVFHHVMQKYVDEVIIKQGKPKKDNEALTSIFDDEIKECINNNPISSKAAFESEKEECRQVLERYIDELHEELNNTPNKKVIGCEINFKDVSYSGELVSDGNIKEPYELLLRGSVDRLDGIICDDGTLKLQIYDYKTGSYAKKETEIDSGNWIQHHVYAIAMEHWANDNENMKELEKRFEKPITAFEFDKVRYVFPYEEDTGKRELPAHPEMNDGKAALPYADVINDSLDIVAKYQNGKQEEAINTSFDKAAERLANADKAKRLANDVKEHCKYCNYTDVCRAINNNNI